MAEGSEAVGLQQQMGVEELQAQAQKQLLEEETKIKSYKPKTVSERAQQAAQLEAKEKEMSEALQALA